MDEIADVVGIGAPPIASTTTDVRVTTGPRSAVAGLDLHLDHAGGRVRDSVVGAIRDAVRSGRLAPGTRLPSSRAVNRAWNVAPFEAFGYADPHGRAELRRALAQCLARARGVRARPCNIVVCSGAQ
jgi:DNA-binding transcriptional MocR family regulator